MNRETKLDILRQNGSLLYKFTNLQNDKEAVLTAMESNPYAYTYASPELRGDKEIQLALVNQNGSLLELVLNASKEVVLAAVKNKGTALRFAGHVLRADKEVVLAAVRKDGSALYYASPDLREDKEVVMAAVQNKGVSLQYAVELQSDKDVVMVAVKHGFALQYASLALRADKEVVLAAVKHFGVQLEFASTELRDDKEVVLAAVHKTPHSIHAASPELQRDEDVIRTFLGREYAAGYHNIHMLPKVGDYVTLALKEPQSNPVVHRVSVLLPDGRVQLNNNTISAIYVRSLNFVPENMVIENSLGLRLRDRSYTIKKRGGKRRKTRNLFLLYGQGSKTKSIKK